MGKEIERKFLVDHEKWNALAKPEGKIYKQGYILNEKERVVRIRVTDHAAFITLKGAADGVSRSEFEYEIPKTQGEEILKEFAISSIEKTRYNIPYNGHLWEIDVFEGVNKGLVVAEIELAAEDETFEKPNWVTEEVSYDSRYTNAMLSLAPYTTWQ